VAVAVLVAAVVVVGSWRLLIPDDDCEGDGVGDDSRIVAFDATSGSERWSAPVDQFSFELGGRCEEGPNLGRFLGSPGEQVTYLDAGRSLHGFDPGTGAETSPGMGPWQSSPIPVVSVGIDGRSYGSVRERSGDRWRLASGGEDVVQVTSRDDPVEVVRLAPDGEARWRRTLTNGAGIEPCYTEPCHIAVGSDAVVFVTQGSLVALDIAEGTILWERPVDGYDIQVVVAGDLVVYSECGVAGVGYDGCERNNQVVGVDIATGQPRWASPVAHEQVVGSVADAVLTLEGPTVRAREASDGTLRWANRPGGPGGEVRNLLTEPGEPGALVVIDPAPGTTPETIVTMLDTDDGEPTWTHRTTELQGTQRYPTRVVTIEGTPDT